MTGDPGVDAGNGGASTSARQVVSPGLCIPNYPGALPLAGFPRARVSSGMFSAIVRHGSARIVRRNVFVTRL